MTIGQRNRSQAGGLLPLDGGLAAFQDDTEKEAQNHSTDLQQAAAFLKSAIPGLTIRAFFVDFEGVWEVESEPETQTAGRPLAMAKA